MAFQRKYKFNWLDHLYYLGKYSVGVSVWFYLLLVLFAPPLTLLLICLIHILADQKYNATIMQVSIYSTCALAVIFCSNWLLKKRRFTPQRERAYFRRYPERKDVNYKYSLLYCICMGLWSITALWGGYLLCVILR